MPKLQQIINELTQVLKQTVEGKYAIALSGSHAKGMADEVSDIDFFMFVENPKSYEQRLKIISDIADKNMPIYISTDFKDGAWGGGMDFYYKGIPIETTVRFINKMDSILKDCLDGKFDIIPALWTTNGYYTYIYLSEIKFLSIIDDPYNLIQRYKNNLESYPIKLQKSIIKKFFARSNMWLDNFHYKSAIEREDILFIGSIVKSTVLDMVQIIFALNKAFFMGDKKLEQQLANLEYCPHKLYDNIEFLMSTPKDKQKLEKQRELLIAIRDRLQYKISELD